MSTGTSGDSARAEPASMGAAQKLLRVLEVLGVAAQPMRLAQVAAEAGIRKPTAHRLLAVLASEDWVTAHEGGVYEMGARARAIAAVAARSPLTQSVDGLLAALAADIGQTVHLGLRAGDRFVYTHKVEGQQGFGIASHVGMQQMLHCTAIGKCILAGMPTDQVVELLERAGMPARTSNTHTSRGSLLTELAAVRERGFAVDDEENQENIRCLAVPVQANGKTVGAVSVSTVTLVLEREAALAFVPKLQQAAQGVHKLLA